MHTLPPWEVHPYARHYSLCASLLLFYLRVEVPSARQFSPSVRFMRDNEARSIRHLWEI